MSESPSTIKLAFGKAASTFSHRGQFPSQDLLPIIPPGAKVASKSAVDQTQAGKIPGRYDFKSGQWWGLTGAWPTMGINAKMQQEAASWPTENVGLRAENWPAVDVDVASEEARDLVEGLVTFHLGNAPVRVRGNSPRALFVFKRIGDEPIRKMRLVFKDKQDVEHAVEFLGAGQQFLIHGRHPSGAFYEWRENADLAIWGANGLTKITAVEARNFMDALVREIEQRGWKIVRDIRLRPAASGAGFAVADLEPIVDVKMALSALRAIPNTVDVLPMREDIVGVLAAFKAAVGKDAQKKGVFADVADWATKYDWADQDYIETVWNSLTHVRVGPERLFGLAHQYGFVGDAKADFDDKEDVEQKIAAAKEAQDDEDAKLQVVAKKLVYWPEAQKWIVKDTGEQLSHNALNCYHGIGTAIAPAGTTGTRSAANRLVNSGLVQRVNGMTYLPGQPQLVSWEFSGRVAMYLNRWQNYTFALPESVTDDDVRPWLNHVEYLFPDADDRNYLIDFLAHIAQHRGRKIRWAPIIIGNQGVGKDLFLRPLIKGLGKTNFRQVEPQELLGRFADFYERELVVVEEVSRSERHDVYEKMKAIISGTASDTVTIERKFEQAYEVPNVVNFVFFSNHTDALNLSEDDRRFFVIMSPALAKDAEYYVSLADQFYREQEGWRSVFAWLLQRDISKFNPDARPKFNESKATMIEDSLPPMIRKVRRELVQGALKHRSIITVGELLDTVASDFSSFDNKTRDLFRFPSHAKKALAAAGWVYRAKQVRLDGEPERVWCRSQDVAEIDNEALRGRYKAEKEKKLADA
jgi:hypothetical protein